MKQIAILFVYIFSALLSHTYAQQTGTFTKNVVIGSSTTTLTFYVPASYDSTKSYKFILNLEPAAQDHFKGYADTSDAIVVATSKSSFSDLTEVVDSAAQWYNFSYNDIYLSGFSSRGATAISVGMANTSYFRGMVLLAPASSSGINYANSKNIPTCIVTGANDSFLSTMNNYHTSISNAGGIIDTAIVPGVGHTPIGPDARTPRIAACFAFVDANVVTSINDLNNEQQAQVKLFPNPASDKLWLSSESNIERIELIDVNGKLVYKQGLSEAQKQFELKLNDLSNGIYFIRVYKDSNVQMQKIIINK